MDLFFEQLIEHYSFTNSAHKRFLCAFTDKKFIRNFPGSLLDNNAQMINFANNVNVSTDKSNWIHYTMMN